MKNHYPDHQWPTLVRIRQGQGLGKPGIFHFLNTSREGNLCYRVVELLIQSLVSIQKRVLGFVLLAENELINEAGEIVQLVAVEEDFVERKEADN